MSSPTVTQPRSFWRFCAWQLAIMEASLFSSFALANEPEFVHDERLLAVTRTYRDLQMCSATAFEFTEDEPLATRYRETAHSLSVATDQAGWRRYEFEWFFQIAIEELSQLELRQNETRESYRRRFFSGKPCEKAMTKARQYLEDGLPAPQTPGQ